MTDLFIQPDGRDMTVWHDDQALLTEKEAGPVLWAHLTATLPTRDDPQPEPTDPAVRVRDSHGREWARVNSIESGDVWVCAGSLVGLTWLDANDEYGPLEVIPPATDAEPEARPFKVGDRVRVAHDAMSVMDFPSVGRGRLGTVESDSRDDDRYSVTCDSGHLALVASRFLTHADADADGERP